MGETSNGMQVCPAFPIATGRARSVHHSCRVAHGRRSEERRRTLRHFFIPRNVFAEAAFQRERWVVAQEFSRLVDGKRSSFRHERIARIVLDLDSGKLAL